MSQYPPNWGNNNPYSPHAPMDPYGNPPTSKPMARAAAIFQFVLGGLMLAGGLCCLGAGLIFQQQGMPPEQMAEIEAQLAEAGLEEIGPWVLLMVLGTCVSLPGLVYLVLGFFVWRASRIAIVISLVVSGLMGVLILLNLAASATQGAGGFAQVACSNGAILAVLVGLCVLLVKAWKEGGAPPVPAQGQWGPYPQGGYGQGYPQQPYGQTQQDQPIEQQSPPAEQTPPPPPQDDLPQPRRNEPPPPPSL